MKFNSKLLTYILFAFLIAGCAGLGRSCSGCMAETYGSDWIIVQYNAYGQPMAAWKLSDASVTNENASDGIYWKDPQTSHLVHISGWYNRVQVSGGRYDEAAKLLGLDENKIGNGKYPKE